jgi:uncharacterized membrane protein YtjA (UPF0391 family)
MLQCAVVFLVVALLAALFGFGGIAWTAAGITAVHFVLFLILFLVSFVFERERGASSRYPGATGCMPDRPLPGSMPGHPSHGWKGRRPTRKPREPKPKPEPIARAILRRHTDVSFPARVHLGKSYNLRVALVPAEEALPGGGIHARPKPHTATMNLLVPPPTRWGAARPPVRMSVSVAAENFEIDGFARAELVVPLEGRASTVQFGLRGLKVGPGRVMIDFTQDGRPMGSVDLAPEVVAGSEADRVPGDSALAEGGINVNLGLGLNLAPPDLVLKVFEHRLTGHPGRMQFVLFSTHRALADLPVLDGDLGTLDLKAAVVTWVGVQLQAVGVLAGQLHSTEDVTRTLGPVGCNLFQQLLPPALQDHCWTFRKRGVKTLMIRSDEPHIP